MNYDLLIGIDVGTQNGVAVWCCYDKKILRLMTLKTYQVIDYIRELVKDGYKINVFIENPHTWVNYKNTSQEKINSRKQGAGSVKRSYKVLEELFIDENINFISVSLQSSLKKLPKVKFQLITGIDIQTNEHERDACMLVYGRK